MPRLSFPGNLRHTFARDDVHRTLAPPHSTTAHNHRFTTFEVVGEDAPHTNGENHGGIDCPAGTHCTGSYLCPFVTEGLVPSRRVGRWSCPRGGGQFLLVRAASTQGLPARRVLLGRRPRNRRLDRLGPTRLGAPAFRGHGRCRPRNRRLTLDAYARPRNL